MGLGILMDFGTGVRFVRLGNRKVGLGRGGKMRGS